MKRLFVLAIVCSWLAVPAARAEDAPPPEALRAAQELSAMVSGDTIAQMSAAMTAQIWPNIEGSLASKIDAATLAELAPAHQPMHRRSTAPDASVRDAAVAAFRMAGAQVFL